MLFLRKFTIGLDYKILDGGAVTPHDAPALDWREKWKEKGEMKIWTALRYILRRLMCARYLRWRIDQELISHFYSSCCSCSSCSCWGGALHKSLSLGRLKSDRNDIWQDCSPRKYGWIEGVWFLMGRHNFNDVISRTKVLSPGECIRSVCPAMYVATSANSWSMVQSCAFYLYHSVVFVFQWQETECFYSCSSSSPFCSSSFAR